MKEKNQRTEAVGEIKKLISKVSSAKNGKISEDELENLIAYICRRKEELRREKEELKNIAKKEAEAAHIQAVTSMELPLDWENPFLTPKDSADEHISDPSAALVRCLDKFGRVDIEYIAFVTGEDYKSVITALKGAIYQNPDTWDECFYKGWETTEEYLSGNLRRKLSAAQMANKKYNGYFDDNIKAIERVLPHKINTDDIYITLGSPWVPEDVINDFINYLLGSNTYKSRRVQNYVVHDDATGTWEIRNRSNYKYTTAATKIYGTEDINAVNIIEKTLNMRAVTVKDEVPWPSAKSGVKKVLNREKTFAAAEKQKIIIEKFKEWVWTDELRKERLENIYENKYSCIRRRIFDGSFLTFDGMSEKVTLYPYQKDAAARIIFSGNTLLAHDVGSGKTYIMIAAAQEMRRMGLSKKNMFVVPNNLVGQWKNIFLDLYPNADILCVEPKSFTPKKRGNVLADIRDKDYDGIIIAYSCFDLIPVSKNYHINDLREKISEMEGMIGKKAVSTVYKNKISKMDRELAELVSLGGLLEDMVCFDELGITRLFVDEAHNYKNVPIETKIENVMGISSGGSKKCRNMLDKVRIVQKNNDGKGVIMATATPITNSLTDAYVMQQYLQSGELALLDLQSFDSWIGMFAEKVTEFEVDVDTNSYRLATRFSKFHNIPELTLLLSSVADFHAVGRENDIPVHDGYRDVLVPKTKEFADYLSEISERADSIRKGYVKRTEDNMLKLTTDGRKAALDLRLVRPETGFTYNSKAARCIESVANVYFKTLDRGSTQLVFCDSSTPKQGFNLYDELKRGLVAKGVPSEEIAYVHDADTEAKRDKLFTAVRNGDIRVLIGSTFKLGLGVNVQDKLIALHHLDVPWRPADMTQREGRILRRGNTNKKVAIFRYITEGSFDAYSWQLLESKQKFITNILSGAAFDRDGTDVDDTVLNYAEIKALAIGSPLVKKRVEAANELARYMILQKENINSRIKTENELEELGHSIKRQNEKLKTAEKDLLDYNSWFEAMNIYTSGKMLKEAGEQRKSLRGKLDAAVKGYILKKEETVFDTYRNFDIILPAHMTRENMYIILSNNGRYRIDLGNTAIGNLLRIDNFINDLDGYVENIKNSIKKMRQRKKELAAVIEKTESYAEMIEKCRENLRSIDERLGVNKDA